ncbi:MAG: phosphotransferase family protein [Candidatus Nanohaloarchaea archaeon]
MDINQTDVVKAVSHVRDENVSNIKDVSSSAKKTFRVEFKKSINLIVCFSSKELKKRFRKEEKVVELVNRRTNIPTQRIVYSSLDSDPMFYIAEEMEGTECLELYEALSFTEKKKIVKQIGKILAVLHSQTEFESHGDLILSSGKLRVQDEPSWKEYLQKFILGEIEKLEGTRFEDLQQNYRKYLKQNLDLLGTEKPVLVHFDVSPDNIFLEDTDVSGIIDWERSFSGHSEWDLAYTETQMIHRFIENDEEIKKLKEAFYSSYRENYRLEDGWKERIEFYKTLKAIYAMRYFESWTEKEGLTAKERKEEEEILRNILKQNCSK